MSYDEMHSVLDRVLEALDKLKERDEQINARLDRASQIQQADAVRVDRLEENAAIVVQAVDELVNIVTNTQSQIAATHLKIDALVDVQRNGKERLDKVDERIDKFMSTVEAYIKGRGANGDGAS